VLAPAGAGRESDKGAVGRAEVRGTARQLLGEAVGKLRERMAVQGVDLPVVTLNFSGVLDLFDVLLSREEPRQATNPTQLVCIDDQEGQFILPLLGAVNPQTDFGRIEGTVADCLIYGPTEFRRTLAYLRRTPKSGSTWSGN